MAHEPAPFQTTIHNHFLDAQVARADREKEWDTTYRRSHPSYVDPRIPQPRITLGKIYRDIRTKLSWLVRLAKSNGKWMQIDGVSEEFEVGDEVDHVVNASFDNNDIGNEDALFRGARKGIKYGDQFWLEKAFFNKSKFVDSKTVNLNLDDVFPDFFSGRWYLIRRHITVNTLGSMAQELSAPVVDKDGNPVLDAKGKPTFADGGVALRAFEKVKQVIKDGKFPDRYGWHFLHATKSTDRAERYGRSGSNEDPATAAPIDDPANAVLTLLEYHETGGDYLVAKVLPDFAKNGVSGAAGAGGEDLWLQKPQPSPYDQCQVVWWSPNFEDDEAWGYGLAEIWGKSADVADWATRAGLKLLARLADPPLRHNKNERLDVETLRNPSGKNIPLEFPEHFGYVEGPSRADAGLLMTNFLKQQGDEALGENETRRGGTGGADTATEVAAAEQGAHSDDVIVASTFFMALQRLANLKIAIYRKHARAEMLIPIVGKGTPKLLRLMPEHLDDKIKFLVRASGAPWGQNSSTRVQTYSAVAQNFADIADRRELGMRMLRESGIPNPEAVFPGPPESVDPETEHEMILNGQQVVVSPEDDHFQHAVKHAPFVQQIQQFAQVEPSEIALATLAAAQNHLNETMIAIQIQQQQQALGPQGGNGSNGISPVQTGPGQPQVLTDRTAGANRDRQSSNDAALGNAPGPVGAPGRPLGGLARGPGR